ncbi:hypothetical protein GJ496_004295 [Pomphorhynchus laevis]|nr:hypothetical protein GJ496_004295 [Pomphorhynchus laevis]
MDSRATVLSLVEKMFKSLNAHFLRMISLTVAILLVDNALRCFQQIQYDEFDRNDLPSNYTPIDPIYSEFYKRVNLIAKTPVDGDITLSGGKVPWEGNVQIFYNNTWGSVCQDGFDYPAATVICRQIGYKDAHITFKNSKFPKLADKIWIDGLNCVGTENRLQDCLHAPWGVNDCNPSRVAGVRCTHEIHRTMRDLITNEMGIVLDQSKTSSREIAVYSEQVKFTNFKIKLVGGRHRNEGRVMIKLNGGEWGNVCGLGFSLFEANQICKYMGKGFGHSAFQEDIFFRKSKHDFVSISGLSCPIDADNLNACKIDSTVNCPVQKKFAGLICTKELPDLYLDLHLLKRDFYLEERYLFYLQCAMEENCVALSAYHFQKQYPDDWHYNKRKLIRFTSAIWNNGTADFYPTLPKYAWIWHLCHAHYHSMEIFARYEIFSLTGMKLTESTKASFCLEDNNCLAGYTKKFACRNFGDQGISPKCVDTYFHDVDCQWIDITDIDPGVYRFQACLNPDYLVAEMSFENNCAACRLTYTGNSAYITNCTYQLPW